MRLNGGRYEGSLSSTSTTEAGNVGLLYTRTIIEELVHYSGVDRWDTEQTTVRVLRNLLFMVPQFMKYWWIAVLWLLISNNFEYTI